MLLGGCKKDNDETPYIILKNSAEEVIPASTVGVPADLNSTVRIYAEIGYERFSGNNLDYDWKIGSGGYTQYSSADGLNITTIGSFNNLRSEKATLDITFSEDIVSAGETVTIRIKDQGTLVRTLAFIME